MLPVTLDWIRFWATMQVSASNRHPATACVNESSVGRLLSGLRKVANYIVLESGPPWCGRGLVSALALSWRSHPAISLVIAKSPRLPSRWNTGALIRPCRTALCIAAAVPATTALRWLKTLVSEGLFIRRADPHDGRRVFVELAPAASRALRRYFAEIGALAVI